MIGFIGLVSGYQRPSNPIQYSIKPLSKYGYIQGLCFRNANLYYGTNYGEVVCLKRDEKANLIEKWVLPVSKRNIRQIKATSSHLLVRCDAVDMSETGRSVLYSLEDLMVNGIKRWNDNTVYEGITEDNQWIRCNARGEIVSRFVDKEEGFVVRKELKLGTFDHVSCATIYYHRLYIMTFQGYLWVINIQKEKYVVEGRHQLNFPLSTVIHVSEPSKPEFNSVFVYIGNQEGEMYFTQLFEKRCVGHMRDRINEGVITQILTNGRGVFVAFDDATIMLIEPLKFVELFRIKGQSHYYTHMDSMTLTPRALFYISDDDKLIRFHTIE